MSIFKNMDTVPAEEEVLAAETAEDEDTAPETEVTDESDESDAAEETEELQDGEDGKNLCPRCGKRTVSKNREVCYRCEEELRHTKFPVTGMIAALLTMALSIFCFVMICLLAAPSIQAFKGSRYAADRNWYSSFEAYEGVETAITDVKGILGEQSKLNYLLSSGLGIKAKQFEAVMHVYDPVRAYSGAENFFGEKTSKRFLNHDKTYKICSDYYSRYENTYNALGESLNMMQEIDSSDKESGERILKLMREKENAKNVDPVFLQYFIATVQGTFGYGNDEMLKTYQKADEYAKKSGDDYSWLYYDELTDCYIKAGDYDAALPYIKHRMEDNISAYPPVLKLMRYYIINGKTDEAEKLVDGYCKENLDKDGDNSDSNLGLLINLERVKGNLEAAEEYVQEGMGKYSSSPEINRQAALIYLAQGKYDKAFESAYIAEYNANYLAYYYNDPTSYTDELFSTIYAAAYLCDKYGEKNTENAAEIPKILEEMKKADLNPKLKEVIDGKTDIKEILTTGVCDFI